ncbi:MAG TPA: hypothetical protein VLV83_20650 [Acidobacteriota bacterium]|nr:hypothetical protein [Acidobacteriota bacterium]
MAQKRISMTVDSELMNNYTATSALAGQRALRMLQDGDGNPLIFTIGGNGQLSLTYQSPDSSSGWKQVSLSASLGSGMRVASFQASQQKDGTIRLAASVHKSGQEGDQKLYLTDDLPNAPKSAWFSGKPGWKARPFSEGAVRVTQILLGTNDDGQGAPLCVVSVQRGEKAEYFTVNADVKDTSWVWNPYPLPENAVEALDMSLGSVQGVRGVYGLYRTAAGSSLIFTSLPDSRKPGSVSYDFPVPSGAGLTCIEALPPRSFFEEDDDDDDWFDGDEDLSFDLYAAGQGLYRFAESRTGKPPQVIAPSQELGQAKALHVEQDEKHVALWVVEEKSRVLQYVLGSQQDQEMNWTAPLPLRNGVTQMSAIRNRGKITNELLLAVSGDDELIHLWQDPFTTTWQESSVPLENTRGAEEFEAYTTVIRFRDEAGMPVLMGKVKVTSSDWIRATVNGSTYSINPETCAEVTPDVQGGITVMQRADNIQTPVLFVEADFLPAKLTVNPAQKIFKGLSEVRSGADLKKATDRDGKPVLRQSVDDQTLNQSAQVLSQLSDMGGKLVPAGVGYRVGQPVPADALDSGYAWSVQFDSQGRPGYRAGQGIQASGKAKGQAHFGDFLESLAQGLKRVGEVAFQVLVEGGKKLLQVVFEVAGKIFEFVLQSIGQVLEAMAWFLQEVLHIDLNDIMRWLGQLFNWDEIKATQQVMVDMVNRVLDYGAGGLDRFSQDVDRFFERVISDVKELKPDVFPSKVRQLHTGSVQAAAEGKVPMGNFGQTPMGSWPQYQVLHGGFTQSGGPPTPGGGDAIMAFFEKALTGFVAIVDQTMQEIVKDVAFAFQDGTLTPEQVLAALGTDVLVGLLRSLQNLARAFLELLRDLVKAIKQAINQSLDIPVISGLYEGIYSQKDSLSAPYAKLSLLNALAFLVAIPTTWICKAIYGEAPFGSGIQSGREAQYEQLFQALPAVG